MDLRVICRWFKCVGNYANNSANLLFCTAFASDVKHVNLLFSERLRSFANVSEVCNLNNVCLGYHG